MNASLENTLSNSELGWNHFLLVLGTAVFLLFAVWMREPELFAFSQRQAEIPAGVEVPQYYAYGGPQVPNLPQVAGASTQNAAGVDVINEDGTLSSAEDVGQVLGASTADVASAAAAVPVKEIPDSVDAVQKYLNDSAMIEGNYINDTDFEAAITSNDQKTIDQQAGKIQNIITELQALPVPHSAVTLQKNKILQYGAAITLLKNYTNADSNADAVGQAMGVFVQSQDTIASETTALRTQFNLSDSTLSNVPAQ